MHVFALIHLELRKGSLSLVATINLCVTCSPISDSYITYLM